MMYAYEVGALENLVEVLQAEVWQGVPVKAVYWRPDGFLILTAKRVPAARKQTPSDSEAIGRRNEAAQALPQDVLEQMNEEDPAYQPSSST